MTYAELLRSQGASEEEIKVLATPVAEKAYAKMQEDATNSLRQYEDQVKKWYSTDIAPNMTKTAEQLKVKEAELAAERARLKSLQDSGLLEVAQSQDAASGTSAGASPQSGQSQFDPQKYNLVTNDVLPEFAKAQGRGMVKLAVLMREHEKLGLPDANWEELHEESLKSGKQLPDYWSEKFKVSEVRARKAEEAQKAHDERVRKDAVAAYLAEHSGTTGDVVAPRASKFNFTRKPADNTTTKSPWLESESARADRAINNVLQKMQNPGQA